MKRRNLITNLALAVTVATTGPALADRISIKMQSAYPDSLPIFGPLATGVPKAVAALTDREVRIQFFAPNELVPTGGMFDAVSSGSVDAAYVGLGLFVAKNEAFAFFDSVPFGPGVTELLAWLEAGGGAELRDELMAQHNMKALTCGVNLPEAGGWFNKLIEKPEDLSGLKMRVGGLGGRALEELGVSTQSLPGGDIYPALERGVIDAAEYSMPVLDQNIGLYEIAKYYYFPGWHQQASIQSLLINLKVWEAMSESQQGAMKAACDGAVLRSIASGEADQAQALAFILSKGTTIKTFPSPVLKALNDAWTKVRDDLAAGDADFARVAKSFYDFRAGYAEWAELGYLR